MVTRYIRKVIRITADDSPNVIVGKEQERRGLPYDEPILPGVLDYITYKQRRATWDPIRQCISLDGAFYKGAEVLLYPPEWLNKAEQYARALSTSNTRRQAKAMGIDTAEGGDSSVWTVVDDLGIIKQTSIKTPDTSVIPKRTIAYINEFDIPPECVFFDQGGGGQEHADLLRSRGYDVQSISFGESVAPEPVQWTKPFDEKKQERREKFSYKNRRAQLYWLLRLRLDPGTPENPYPWNNGQPFGIPQELAELRRQLTPIPLLWDEEGRVMMLPKRRTHKQKDTKNLVTLIDLLKCSPDEADSLVLANFGLQPDSAPVNLEPLV